MEDNLNFGLAKRFIGSSDLIILRDLSFSSMIYDAPDEKSKPKKNFITSLTNNSSRKKCFQFQQTLGSNGLNILVVRKKIKGHAFTQGTDAGENLKKQID